MPRVLGAHGALGRRHSFVGATSGAGSTYCVRPVREAPWTNAPGGAEPARCDTTQRLSWRKKPPSFSAALASVDVSFLLDSTACLARLALCARGAEVREGDAGQDRAVVGLLQREADRVAVQSSFVRVPSSANARAEPATILDKAAASAPSRRLLESQA